MHSYWYVSQDKLQALGAFDRAWLSRIRPSARVGLGPASVGIDMDSPSSRTLTRAAARAEQQLRGERLIGDIGGFAAGAPPAQYFESSGPASRAVIEDMLWVAGIDGEIAFLLVGSAFNAIGARHERLRRPSPTSDPLGAARYLVEHPEHVDDVFSPSVDPIGAARYLLQHPLGQLPSANADAGQTSTANTEAQININVLAYAWEALMRRSLDLLGDDVSALPRAHSISLYAAHRRMDGPEHSPQVGPRSLVLGTPLYVEQVI
jgi:Family of unknown function (DUF7019)